MPGTLKRQEMIEFQHFFFFFRWKHSFYSQGERESKHNMDGHTWEGNKNFIGPSVEILSASHFELSPQNTPEIRQFKRAQNSFE